MRIESADWQSGEYTFRTSLGEPDFSCHVHSDGSLQPRTCPRAVRSGYPREVSGSVSADGAFQVESADAPDSLTVEVRHAGSDLTSDSEPEGDRILQRTLEPDYALDEPNGPDCGYRRRATVTLQVP